MNLSISFLKANFTSLDKTCCPFRPYLLCSKMVKPGHYSVIRWHIMPVLLTYHVAQKFCGSFIFCGLREFLRFKMTKTSAWN